MESETSIAWTDFATTLNALDDIGAAWGLANTVGRFVKGPAAVYYRNLGAFVETFQFPAEASSSERHLYLELLRRAAVKRPDLNYREAIMRLMGDQGAGARH